MAKETTITKINHKQKIKGVNKTVLLATHYIIGMYTHIHIQYRADISMRAHLKSANMRLRTYVYTIICLLIRVHM